MAGVKVRPEELSIEITAALKDYTAELAEGIKKDCREVAKQCVKDIKARAPVLTGDYKKGWTYKVAYESADDIRLTVYNRTDPQLAHLLEFGHAVKNGTGKNSGKKRVDPREHIRPAEQAAKEALIGKAKVRIAQR